MPEFTHIDDEGRVRMVDVSDKESTLRIAIAQGIVTMTPDTFEKIYTQSVKKGNVLETARIAGIMAAKRTAELIPMCHPLAITHVQVDFFPVNSYPAIFFKEKDMNGAGSASVRIEAQVRIIGKTGVEMEALTAVSVAALTIYDMCKSYDRAMVISDICLLEKSGGKSKNFVRKV